MALLYFIVFLLIYFAADARHDVWVKLESDHRLQAQSAAYTGNQLLVEDHLKKAKAFSAKWHALDAALKGFVVANIAWWIVGLDWWLPVMAGLTVAIRWVWFDACWNWFRGISFWYKGGSAKSDTLLAKDWLFFFIKFFLLWIMIIITLYKLNLEIA